MFLHSWPVYFLLLNFFLLHWGAREFSCGFQKGKHHVFILRVLWVLVDFFSPLLLISHKKSTASPLLLLKFTFIYVHLNSGSLHRACKQGLFTISNTVKFQRFQPNAARSPGERSSSTHSIHFLTSELIWFSASLCSLEHCRKAKHMGLNDENWSFQKD